MPPAPATTDLPLGVRTPSRWVGLATADELAFLQDHAHLERKAASNALDLLGRWPERVDVRAGSAAGDRWVHVLTSIAQDELRHLAQVLRLLERRGGHLERAHTNDYAAGLHAHVRRGQGRRELLDRLLVSALIELRSCERFLLLSDGMHDAELAAFYASLTRSEMGHYRAFVDLAASLPEVGRDAAQRFAELLGIEGGVAVAQAIGPCMHSGWGAP